MMGSWATFWGWILGISLVLFAVISVVVTIGGFRDIRALLPQGDAPWPPEPAPQETPEAAPAS